jgi:uncharacterized protein (DUF362 family)
MNTKPLVSIAGKQGPYKNVLTALAKIDLSGIKNKSVLIKPNVGRKALAEHGINTHPLAIAAVIESINKYKPSKIAIGESPLVGVSTFEAFERSGITEIAEKYGVELIDFDARPPIKKEIPNSRILENTKISAAVCETDFLISVPVAKTHMHTGVTLGIKNLKGCLYRHEKVRYHQLEYKDMDFPEKTLDSAISDLATILLPDLTVVDGYIGMEGLGPSGGEPVKSDFAVASLDAFGADVFACTLMGIDPASIPHLNLISIRNKLPIDLASYAVYPADFQQFVHPYKRPPENISVEYEDVVVYDCESCSSCLSTLMLFLKRFKDDMSPYLLDDGKFHIAIGKGVNNTKVGTVFLGNCTKNSKDNGIYVPGCPPVPTRIYEAITGKEPFENEPEVK